MLEVGIHRRDVPCIACKHPLDAGHPKIRAAPPAGYNAHAHPIHRLRGRAVRRVVIDENNLPFIAGERSLEPADEDGNVGLPVERGNHDR